MKDAIRYVIKVIAVIERKELVGKEWARTTAEVNSKFEYTPEIEKVVQKQVDVYEQQVDKLDMAALVKVVNGIA